MTTNPETRDLQGDGALTAAVAALWRIANYFGPDTPADKLRFSDAANFAKAELTRIGSLNALARADAARPAQAGLREALEARDRYREAFYHHGCSSDYVCDTCAEEWGPAGSPFNQNVSYAEYERRAALADEQAKGGALEQAVRAYVDAFREEGYDGNRKKLHQLLWNVTSLLVEPAPQEGAQGQ